MEIDVFICHATEDKDAVARPLAQELQRRGIRVWYDEFVLQIGDSLREEIDRGLATCRFGVVVLSHQFFAKRWTQHELNGLAAREIARGSRLILPIWHQLDRDAVSKYSPTLADKVGISTSGGISRVADHIIRAVLSLLPETGSNSNILDLSMILGAYARGLCQNCGGEVVYAADGSETATCKQCGWQGVVA